MCFLCLLTSNKIICHGVKLMLTKGLSLVTATLLACLLAWIGPKEGSKQWDKNPEALRPDLSIARKLITPEVMQDFVCVSVCV